MKNKNRKVIALSRKDLIKSKELEAMESIQAPNDFKKSSMSVIEYYGAERVVFFDSDDKHVVLKDRNSE